MPDQFRDRSFAQRSQAEQSHIVAKLNCKLGLGNGLRRSATDPGHFGQADVPAVLVLASSLDCQPQYPF